MVIRYDDDGTGHGKATVLRLVYADPDRKIWTSHEARETWVEHAMYSAGSHPLGNEPPHYPVPALRTDSLYWRLPKGTDVMTLIYAWHLWMQR